MNLMYMIDIETTGTNKETDDILEIAIVPIMRDGGYWRPSYGKDVFHTVLHTDRKPESKFAFEHMQELYKKCNETSKDRNYEKVAQELQLYLHPELGPLDKHATPKMFMGWNASTFDLDFMFKKGLLNPSYYYVKGDREVLGGDVHYRVYEQSGAVELVCDVTGLDRKAVLATAEQMLEKQHLMSLPKGKSHDALYDCYKQINMMNGLIALARSGIKSPNWNR